MTDIFSARQLLDHLVSFPTVSSDTNLPLIYFVRDYFASNMGSIVVVIPVRTAHKAGIGGAGRTECGWRRGTCRAIQMWCPCRGRTGAQILGTVVEKDGRLYGRGTCDMKGFVALAMAAMVKAKSLDLQTPAAICPVAR